MTSQVKQSVPLSLLNIFGVGSKVSSYLKTTIHEAFTFWYHINKIHTQINQLALTDKVLSQSGTQLCVPSVAVQSWQMDFHGLHERLPWLFQHSCLIWTQIILVMHQRLEEYPSYIMVQWTAPSQCLAIAGIALCLHAVQQCGCKIIHREWKQCFWWLCYTGW